MKTPSMLLLALFGIAAAAPAQQRIDERIATSPTGTVEVVNTSGSVRVVGWNRNEIRVTGTLGEGTERLQISPEGDRTTVRVVLPRRGRNVQSSDLEVRVPARKNVVVRTVSAGVRVSDVQESVEARSVSGAVDVSGRPRDVIALSRSGAVVVAANTGSVQAESTSGAVQVRGNASRGVEASSVSGAVDVSAVTPEVRAKSVSGAVRVRDARGRVTVSTVSGRAAVEGRGLESGSVETVTGNVRMAATPTRTGTVRLQSHSGNVELALPRGTPADFDVSSFSGRIDNALGPAAEQTGRGGRGQEVRFATGQGGARIAVRTFSGDVKLVAR